jgi:hypothetical protein
VAISIELWELANAMPGLTASHSISLGEAAAVCLESQRHQTGVSLHLEQPVGVAATLHWRSPPQEAFGCHTGDRATEDGACGVAILLARSLTGQVVLFRSERKESCDYWLGPPDFPRQAGLKGMSRIEVSGIRQGDIAIFRRRHREKREQVSKLDHSSDRYVSIVEFGAPMAVLEKL